MINMTSHQLLELFPQQMNPGFDFEFTGVVTDTRKPCKGSLFVAIRGENFDGHDFIHTAAKKGAAAIVVERELESQIPQIVVDDCIRALAVIANYWRKQVNPKLIAITGSNGKTTVKEMLARILSARYQTLKTAGNFNNEIGVPLTLFRLSAQDRYAVIEMGANHIDEIRRLVAIAEPDIVYVNNASATHIEGFGSLQNVIEAKGEIYQYCKPDAIAVFNEDEEAFEYWKSVVATQSHRSFSLSQGSGLSANYANLGQGLQLKISAQKQTEQCEIGIQGKHNAMNALAAVTLAMASGFTLRQAASGLDGFNAVKGRLQFLTGPQGSRLIDDSYNANPASLSVALKVLCELDGKAWLALGDMAELGKEAALLHEIAVTEAYEAGVEKFFAFGEKSCQAAIVFGRNGYCFSMHNEMAACIHDQITPDVNLLVKGSRSSRMEKVIAALTTADATSETQMGGRRAL